jgi:hypothetical protein
MEVFDAEERERCLARYEELRGGTLHEELVRAYAEGRYDRCFADDVEVHDDRGSGWPELRGRRALLEHVDDPPLLTVLDATEDTLILHEELAGEELVSYNELREGRIAWRINCDSEERARAWARRRRSSQRIASRGD